jgi:hypothetical protein
MIAAWHIDLLDIMHACTVQCRKICCGVVRLTQNMIFIARGTPPHQGFTDRFCGTAALGADLKELSCKMCVCWPYSCTQLMLHMWYAWPPFSQSRIRGRQPRFWHNFSWQPRFGITRCTAFIMYCFYPAQLGVQHELGVRGVQQRVPQMIRCKLMP